MGTKSQFFRAFVEGQTISDGRTVTAEMIDQAVETFNAETYTPGINIEHIAGFSPEPPFNRYGDVIATKAQTDTLTIDGTATPRRALYLQVDAHDQLVKVAENGQKPFPSVELTGDYAGTGKVGLVGLAFTDNPASIGTEKLKFSRRAPGTVFSTAAEGVELKFAAKPGDGSGVAEALTNGFAKLAAMFSSKEPDKPKQEEPKPANDNAFDAAAFTVQLGQTMAPIIAAAVKPANDGLSALQADFAALKGKLEETPEGRTSFSRPLATGGGTQHVTDC